MFLIIINFDVNYHCFDDYYVLKITDILMSIFFSIKETRGLYKSMTTVIDA